MKIIYTIPLCLLLTGCALTRDYVCIDYQPQLFANRIVDDVEVAVNITDSREMKDVVGCKKNGYGMEMAYILAENDVSQVLKDAVTCELQKRGFVIAEGGHEIEIELCKFINDFKVGFFSGEAVSEAVVNVSVKNKEGNIEYKRVIFGSGEEDPCFLFSGKNASLALQYALQDAVQKIVSDQHLIDLLCLR